MTLEFTIKNGVRFYPLTMENSISLANEILESGDVTSEFHAGEYFATRIQNDFVGTYEINVKREKDYQDFVLMLVREGLGKLAITYEEWKTGTKQDGKRSQRLGKWLRKEGVSQFTLDFYSQQIKEERKLYFTVSDRVQHITGMSFYSNMQWDGMNGSSCQNPENEYEDCVQLLASLADNKMLVCFTHDSLEDLENMEVLDGDHNVWLARTLAQIITVDGVQYLITTNQYGNNTTKNMLSEAIRALNGNGIFSVYDMPNPSRHREHSTGTAIISYHDEVHVYDTIDEYVSCECPACGGSGNYTVYSNRTDNRHEIDCPACGGSGEYEVNVYIDLDEWVEIEDEEELEPYAEGYSHNGTSIYINVDYAHIKEHDKRGQAEEQDEQTA